MTANVAKKGDGYEATFEGDCGRPYKYAITMEGRAAGKAVLFKGTADLGPKDGGVYDWIGRATEKEFVRAQGSRLRAQGSRLKAQGSGLRQVL